MHEDSETLIQLLDRRMRCVSFIVNVHGSFSLLWSMNGYRANGDCPSANFKVYPGHSDSFTLGSACAVSGVAVFLQYKLAY